IDVCRVSVPELRTVAPGRQSACHRGEEVLTGLRPLPECRAHPPGTAADRIGAGRDGGSLTTLGCWSAIHYLVARSRRVGPGQTADRRDREHRERHADRPGGAEREDGARAEKRGLRPG